VHIHKNLWRVRFHTTRPLKAFAQPLTVASDYVMTSNYAFEGKTRNHPVCIFQYTVEGAGIFHDASGEYLLPKGTGFLCEANDPETGYYFPENSTTPWIHLFVSFTGATYMVRELVNRFGAIYRFNPDSPLIARFGNYQRYANSIIEVTPGEGASIINGLLSNLADIGEEDKRETANAWLVREARRFIQTHLEENFNVAELARNLNVSQAHLSRVFRKELGTPPLLYLTREKIRHACELLLDTKQSGKEIHLRLGYDNASHFARTFRRIIGLSPQQFRQRGTIPLY